MEKVRLGDYTSIKTGKLDANASKENGEYPFFTCSNEPLRIDKYSYDCECVLVAGNGDLNVKYYKGKFDAYQRTYIIESINKSEIDTKYLFYIISSKIEQLRKKSIGGVIKYIRLNNLTDINFKKLNLIEQKKLVNELDTVQEVIDLRKKQIEELDELIKSQFVEMFGDVKETRKISDVAKYFSRGKSPNYVENSKIEVINQACIYWNEFRFENVKYQDEARMFKSLDKLIKKNDILITSTGTGTLGRCNVYLGENDKYIADGHVSIFRPDIKILNPIYFKYFFMQDKIQRKLYSECVNGSTNQIELSKDKFLNFSIVIPSVELQNQFAEIVVQINKQKSEIQKSLEKTEKLMDSLMNEYFE